MRLYLKYKRNRKETENKQEFKKEVRYVSHAVFQADAGLHPGETRPRPGAFAARPRAETQRAEALRRHGQRAQADLCLCKQQGEAHHQGQESRGNRLWRPGAARPSAGQLPAARHPKRLSPDPGPEDPAGHPGGDLVQRSQHEGSPGSPAGDLLRLRRGGGQGRARPAPRRHQPV